MHDAPFIPAWLDDAGLPALDFRVLCHLWRRRNHRTGLCCPSAASIAKIVGCTRKTVFPALDRLEGSGHLIRLRKSFGGSNLYELVVSEAAPIVPLNGTIETAPNRPPQRDMNRPPKGDANRPPKGDTKVPLTKVPPKEVCVSAEPLPSHTPAFLSAVQTDYPTKDIPAIWLAMLAEYANKPQRLTEAKLREWSERETVKVRKYVNQGAPIAPAQDGPPAGWLETAAYKRSVHSNPNSQFYTTVWREVFSEWRAAIVSERRESPIITNPPAPG